jgi:hypothetical protein
LCITDPLSSSGTQLSSLASRNFRRGGWFDTATREHGPEFRNLRVDTEFLLFKAFNSGDENLGSEL